MLRAIAQMALFLAIVFEIAVWDQRPGIGYPVFWLSALLATLHCNRVAERASWLPSPWMFLPSLVFALSLTLYDAVAVRVWSCLLGLTSLLWAVGWNLVKERDAGALGRLLPLSTAHIGRLTVAGQGVWKPLLCSQNARPSAPVLRGILLAIPLLLVFGALLSSADMIFARALESLQGQMGHVSPTLPIRVGLWMLLFSAWLKLWLTSGRAEAPQSRSPLGSVEMLVALGAVNLLLLTFLAIQVRYLFGGAALVEALGLNYADYARKGFFELSACIALILPLVMVAYQTAESHQDARLRWAGGAMVLQAGGLAISAFRRMMLYIEAFGMSVERFYAAAGILVALAVLAWAAFACWRPRKVSWVLERQTVTVFFLLAGLAMVNVEAGVCRYNLQRAAQGRDLDLEYFRTLSCDVVPVLAAAMPSLTPAQRFAAEQVLEAMRVDATSWAGFRWNLSRSSSQRFSASLPPR